ncbi:putative eukaryotic translation initiation factor EIF-2B subunit 3 [Pseudomassariella vexata]|uniref:Translation initiation factor eIF2B subunit gamma n=1 Tax=Pseudomassariella vexata TaxID=1141098 RepID=A0A1Y2DL20_9PEZI|nr:putative eukaryotic translation initiation factor EIF-2B subunit 3 [Pseudomassariella vexata]ORY59953.1 putative eukaryotic translation initiation factor EIF-2B subunit 3 [Pseudomassariella vexata]
MPHAVNMPAPGLQALILCGPGMSFTTFLANLDENPKALLPIANRPMVWYPIDFCYRMGITNITLICPPTAAAAIDTALKTNPFLTNLPHPWPELLAPENLDENTGTAEILRLPEVRAKVTTDFLVLPCDLVCELGGDKLLQTWMVRAADRSALNDGSRRGSGGLGVWYDTKTVTTPVKSEMTDFIATAPLAQPAVPTSKDSLLHHLSKLVIAMPTDTLSDIKEMKNGLPIRHALFGKHAKVRLLTTHRDAHIYIFPQWIMDFVAENPRFDSISEDVIGWWAKASWQTGLAEKLGMKSILHYNVEASEEGSTHGDDNDAASSPTTRQPRPARHAIGNLRTPTIPPMLAYIHPSGGSIIRRVDDAQLQLTVSLQLAKLPSVEEAGADASPFAHVKKVAYPEGVKPRTTITRQDSLLAENVTVDEKTSIKESVVGASCQIKEGAKLFQCLLMEGVVIGKSCKLTRCILGKNSVVGEGSTLTNCEVQENLLVEPKTEDKDNRLMSSEGLEATQQEIDDLALADEEFEM